MIRGLTVQCVRGSDATNVGTHPLQIEHAVVVKIGLTTDESEVDGITFSIDGHF